MLFFDHVELHSCRRGVDRELYLTRTVFLPMMKLERGKKVMGICKGRFIIISHRIKAG